MLIIRNQQLHAFGVEQERDFALRMRAHIAQEYPGQAQRLGEEGQTCLVAAAIAKARAGGIDTVGAVAQLIDLMVRFGEEFERAPHKAWANALLARTELPGSLRVRLIRDRFDVAAKGRVVVYHPAPT